MPRNLGLKLGPLFECCWGRGGPRRLQPAPRDAAEQLPALRRAWRAINFKCAHTHTHTHTHLHMHKGYICMGNRSSRVPHRERGGGGGAGAAARFCFRPLRAKNHASPKPLHSALEAPGARERRECDACLCVHVFAAPCQESGSALPEPWTPGGVTVPTEGPFRRMVGQPRMCRFRESATLDACRRTLMPAGCHEPLSMSLPSSGGKEEAHAACADCITTDTTPACPLCPRLALGASTRVEVGSTRQGMLGNAKWPSPSGHAGTPRAAYYANVAQSPYP